MKESKDLHVHGPKLVRESCSVVFHEFVLHDTLICVTSTLSVKLLNTCPTPHDALICVTHTH